MTDRETYAEKAAEHRRLAEISRNYADAYSQVPGNTLKANAALDQARQHDREAERFEGFMAEMLTVDSAADKVAEALGIATEAIPTSGNEYVLLTPEQVDALLGKVTA